MKIRMKGKKEKEGKERKRRKGREGREKSKQEGKRILGRFEEGEFLKGDYSYRLHRTHHPPAR